MTGAGRRIAVLAIALLAFALPSWYPYQLEPPRLVVNAFHVAEGGAWRFDGSAMATLDGVPAWFDDVDHVEHLSVDLELAPASTDVSSPMRIIGVSSPASYGSDTRRRHIAVIQQGPDVVVALRRVAPVGSWQTSIVGEDVLSAGAIHHLRVDVADSLTLRVDGTVAAEEALLFGWSDAWDRNVVLTVGNSPSGMEPWQGELFAAEFVLDAERWDVLADPAVTAPPRYWATPPRLRESLPKPVLHVLSMGALHIGVGGALGALFMLLRLRRTLVIAVAWAATVSIVVNAAKIVIATRHPSMGTVLLQIGGACLGAALIVNTRRHGSRFVTRIEGLVTGRAVARAGAAPPVPADERVPR